MLGKGGTQIYAHQHMGKQSCCGVAWPSKSSFFCSNCSCSNSPQVTTLVPHHNEYDGIWVTCARACEQQLRATHHHMRSGICICPLIDPCPCKADAMSGVLRWRGRITITHALTVCRLMTAAASPAGATGHNLRWVWSAAFASMKVIDCAVPTSRVSAVLCSM